MPELDRDQVMAILSKARALLVKEADDSILAADVWSALEVRVSLPQYRVLDQYFEYRAKQAKTAALVDAMRQPQLFAVPFFAHDDEGPTLHPRRQNYGMA